MYTGNSSSFVLLIYSFKIRSYRSYPGAFENFNFIMHFDISSVVIGELKLLDVVIKINSVHYIIVCIIIILARFVSVKIFENFKETVKWRCV